MLIRKHHVVAAALITVGFGLAAGLLLLTKDVSGQAQTVKPLGAVAGPLPPPVMPPDIIALTKVEKLGKYMLYDITLSNPEGYACATCHVPTAGFTGPSSIVNLISGTMPGVVPGRFGNRKPQSYVYAAFAPVGPKYDATAGVYIGGTFWDGRTTDLAGQAHQPPINPDEMDNTPTNGIYPPVFGGYSSLLAQKLQSRPYTHLFYEIYGKDVFTKYTPEQIFELFCLGVAAYQSTGEVCGFSSKYDASKYGVPPKNLYTLSASEERGRILYGVGPNPSNDPTYGGAQCFQCHSSAGLPAVTALVDGKETFTMYCYANIGTPKNYGNPYYDVTDKIERLFILIGRS